MTIINLSSKGVYTILVLLAGAVLISGCAMVGPDYIQPEAPQTEEWIEADDARIRSEASDYDDWWTIFNDPVLNELIEKAYQQNLTLQIAGIRILEARAVLGVAVGNQYPQTQQGLGNISRNKISENAVTAFPDPYFSLYDLSFDAAWEVDIWGKFRRSVESSVANLQASIASYDDFLVTLTAEVARTYVIIRTLEERLAVALENVGIQERSLRIAEVRFEGGAVTELDVQQAKSLLKDTQASIPRLAAGLRQAKNALAILLGIVPRQIDAILAAPGAIPQAPLEVVVDIPAQLLRRRPDIRLAEYRVAAQSPLIGVAKAELYPSFDLFGTIGLTASDLDDWFNADSSAGVLGAGFRWNIFNYGRIRNRVRVEDARFQQTVVGYENTVLQAYQEVEDALAGFLRAQEEAGFLLDGVTASKRSVDLSLLQYREGLVDYQRVLDTQRFLVTQQDQYTATKGTTVNNLIALYKALGGGWQIREGRDFVAEDIKIDMQERTNWGGLLKLDAQAPEETEAERRRWRWPDW